MNGLVVVDARAECLYVTGNSLSTPGHRMNDILRVLPLDVRPVDLGQVVLDVWHDSAVTQRGANPPDPSPALVALLARAGVRTYAQYARGVRQVTVGKFMGIGQNPLNPRGPLFVTPFDNLGPKGGFAPLEDQGIEIPVEEATPERLGQAVIDALAMARPGKGRLAPAPPVAAMAAEPAAMTSGQAKVTSRDGRTIVESRSRTVQSFHVLDSYVILSASASTGVLGQAVIDALAQSRFDVPVPENVVTPEVEALAAGTGYPTYVEFTRGARHVTVEHEFWDRRRSLVVTPFRYDYRNDEMIELSDEAIVIEATDATPDNVGDAVSRALAIAS